jgi:hypothetical protein
LQPPCPRCNILSIRVAIRSIGVAGESTPQTVNGTSSRIFDPNKGTEAPPRRTAAAPGDGPSDQTHDSIERDPQTGRFLKPGFSSYMVSKARRLGLTDDDLADISDPAELRDVVREREFEARVSQVFDPQRVAAALKAQNGNGTNLDTPDARQPFDLGLNDEEDGPRLKELLTKLRDHYESEIDGLKKTVDELKGKTASREAREVQSVDRAFERAFAGHPQVFGKGLGKDVTATKMSLRRAAAAFWHETGGDPDGIGDAVNNFVKDELGGGRKPPRAQRREESIYDEEELDEEELDEEETDEAEEWERGVLRRPTQAGPREAPAGRDKAVQNLKRRLPASQGARDARTPRGIYLNHGSRDNGARRQR